MDKQQILSFIKTQLEIGKITKEDILQTMGDGSVFERAHVTSTETENNVHTGGNSSSKLVNVFYVIGMIITVIGITILVAQNWQEIGFWGRLCVTLGISAATYFAGLIARGEDQRVFSQIMFTISVVLAPLGIFIVMNEIHMSLTRNMYTAISFALAVLYGAAFLVTRRNILILIVIGFLTAAYFGLLDIAFSFTDSVNIMKIAIIVLGISYMAIAQSLKIHSEHSEVYKERKGVVNILSSIGTLAILGVGITFGGFGDMLYFLLIFGSFYASVYIRNSAVLVIGAVFLMAHIVKITSKYFVDSIGWPIALMICGFVIIGVGFLTFQVNKKYIKAS